jgi:molybdate transport system ATP-binding protein
MSADLVANFQKRFPSGTVVRGALSTNVETASVTALFGPSGCGKTTVLRSLAGLERPDSGSIHYGPDVWFDAQRGISIPPQRRSVGFLPQDYALFPHLTVFRNIAYGLANRRSAESRERVGGILQLLGIAELAERYPSQLSSGQQQRVALARSIVCRPRLLLLDEPLSALDAPVRERLRGELRRVLLQLGTPAIIVTHDPVEALSLADAVVVMVGGDVRQAGPVHCVFSQPRDREIARVVGFETIEPGVVVSSRDGLATVEIGGVQLTALAPDGHKRHVFVCIRGEDVIIERGMPSGTSARNQLTARIASRTSEGALVRLGLDCGFQLTALVTRPASEELNLRIGDQVRALIKAPAIHLVSRS